MASPHWYRLRYEALARDNFQCQYCGQFAPNVRLEIDHIIPVVEGGTDDLENLKTSCYACNRGKNSLWLHLQWKARVTPGLEVRSAKVTIAEQILEALNQPRSARELATVTGRTIGTIRVIISRMLKLGQIECASQSTTGAGRFALWRRLDQ